MYPSAPDFRSAAPGSVWFTAQFPGEASPRAFETQWDVILRMFQGKAKQSGWLPAVYLFDRAQGRCTAGQPALEQLVTAWNATLRRKDQLAVSGTFDADTADAFGYLLCASGQQGYAPAWAQVLASGGAIPREALQRMIWLAFFVSAVGQDVAGESRATSLITPAAIVLPETTVLPLQTTVVTSAPEDRDWVGAWRPGTDPVPQAPSVAAANAAARPPAPAASGFGFGSALLVAVGGWFAGRVVSEMQRPARSARHTGRA